MTEAAWPRCAPDQDCLATYVLLLIVYDSLPSANIHQFQGSPAFRSGWRPPGKTRWCVLVGYQEPTRGGPDSQFTADRLPRQGHGNIHEFRLAVQGIPLHPYFVQFVGSKEVCREVRGDGTRKRPESGRTGSSEPQTLKPSDRTAPVPASV